MVGRVIHNAPHRRGSILMEFVIVAPIILLLVSMVLQFSHIWTARQITAYAAYCATRAIMAVPPGEQEEAAKKAAELACAWMSLVGLPEAVVAARSRLPTGSKVVHLGRLHDRTDISDAETVYEDREAPIEGEVMIPGWGSIPGSDSARVRVQETKILTKDGNRCDGNGIPLAAVTVKFKFPLVLPLAGRMISWWVNRPDEGLESFDYGNHEMSEGRPKGWAGQQVVMDAEGNAEAIAVPNDAHSADGKYPFITLTETCVLPMPYSTARFPKYGYRRDGDSSAVSDLVRGGGP